MDINLTLLMQAIGFGLFIWFTAKFIWPPLMRAVETRQKQIAEGLAAGEQGRQSLVSAEKRIADMLAESSPSIPLVDLPANPAAATRAAEAVFPVERPVQLGMPKRRRAGRA